MIFIFGYFKRIVVLRGVLIDFLRMGLKIDIRNDIINLKRKLMECFLWLVIVKKLD